MRTFPKVVSVAVLLSTTALVPAGAEDSAELLRLQSIAVVAESDLAREQYLAQRVADLKTLLKQKNLSKEEKKALKAEQKAIKKEYKTLKKANSKAMKAHNSQIAKLKKNLVKKYGQGPYPAETERFVSDKPPELQKFYRSLYIEGERNATLNFNRLGVAAMEMGYFQHAEWAFDQAIDRIEAIYADSESAKAAKSKFKAENVKEFKGEPYERAMAYYYRGLLYLSAGDFENARAVFRAGEYQDSVSMDEEFQADFAVLNYLDGWSLHCQGRDASEPFARAAEVRAELAPPDPSHNILLVSEMGLGPIKFGDGQYNEVLKFKPDERFGETEAQYLVQDAAGAERFVPLNVATSVSWQSSTRGGRQVDGILEGKAQFKETTAAVGDGLQTAGTAVAAAGIYSGDGDAALVGAGVAVIGAIFGGLSASTKPEADVRMWDNLPDLIAVGTDDVSNLDGYRFASVYEGSGDTVADATEAFVVGGNDTCGIAWTRSRSAAEVEESSPGARMTWKKMRKQKKAIQQKDVVFRNRLAADAPTVTGR